MRKTVYILAALISGCSSSIPIPSEEDIRSFNVPGGNISLEELRSDRQLYVNKCSGCHSLNIPSQYSEFEWNTILPLMNKKSKLTTQESDRIKRYLTLYSAKKK